MNPNQELWEKGDFTRIAATMRASGEALVKTLGIVRGMSVLDLGCGDGTTALPAAELGARVLGIDIARNLVEVGNRRANERGLASCRFRQGDATNLEGVGDRSFDLVVSFFGAMFAPRPLDVAREMVRVTRRGGRIVMGNWIPKDQMLVSQLLEISASFAPPPPEGFISPMRWGIERDVLDRFLAAGVPSEHVAFARDTYAFDFDGSPSELVTNLRHHYGPTMNAFEAAEKNGRADELARALEVLFVAQSRSRRLDRTVIPATFLRVTVTL